MHATMPRGRLSWACRSSLGSQIRRPRTAARQFPKVAAFLAAALSRSSPIRGQPVAGPASEAECRERAAEFMAVIATEALAAATAMEAVAALILATAEAGRPPRVSALAAASRRWAT